MSLFDKLKTTSLKSLKYGDDSFGGGNSLEPIIQKPIRNDNLVGFQTPPQQVALENRERISKLLKNTSRGYQFIQKQKSLSLSNTRLESLTTANSSRINSLAIYNEKNTLEQIGDNPYHGSHLDRFGLTPFMEDDLKYINIALANNKSNNRLTNLYKKLEVGNIPTSKVNDFKSGLRNTLSGLATFSNIVTSAFNVFGGNSIVNNINSKINKINKISSPFLSPIIDQYAGGPNTKDGIGFTTIRRFDYTNDLDKVNANLELVRNNVNIDRTTGKTRNLLQSDPKTGTLLVQNTFNNAGGDASLGWSAAFSNEIKNSVYDIKTDINGKNFSDIVKKSKSLEKTTHTVLEESSTVGTRYRYNISKKSAVNVRSGSKINFVRTFGATNGKLEAYNDTGIDGRMPIIFTIINPFTGISTPQDRYEFSAYINGFKDSSNPEYSDIKYIGRSEYFSVYTGFKRDVSFNLQIPCFTLTELRDKHKSLAALYSSTMGKYDNSKLGGILYKLKLGNYLNNEAGVITSLSYDVPNDSSWDIDEELAHNLNVSVSFRVIHDTRPEYSSNSNLFTIGPANIQPPPSTPSNNSSFQGNTSNTTTALGGSQTDR